MDEFLEKAGITLLRDEYVLIDDSFYLYGRPDYERPGRGIDKRKTPQEITEGMDVSLPVLVIDHEPRELQELADTGVDVDLCGHTHDGQVFPGNIVIRFFWENPCGYLKKGNMHNIVTSLSLIHILKRFLSINFNQQTVSLKNMGAFDEIVASVKGSGRNIYEVDVSIDTENDEVDTCYWCFKKLARRQARTPRSR